MARPKPPLREAFKARVQIDAATGCWMWTGDKGKAYGIYQLDKSRNAGGVYIRTRVYAHRLSWELHRGEIPGRLFVLHTCDTPLCVNPGHLFLGTKADNSADMVAKDRQSRGERQWRSRLTEAIVREIMASSESSYALADRIGVKFQTINDIRCGKTWAHLGLTRMDNPKENQGRKGSAHFGAILTESDIPLIRARISSGESCAAIGDSYGVSGAVIRHIRSGNTWRHVA